MIDVLNLEWTSYSSRDRNISSLVCNYLRYQGLSVVEETIFRGFEMIDKYKPRLVFIANGVGAGINFEIVKYASLKGKKVVTLISEGNFKDDIDTLSKFFWGWNKDKVFYEEVQMQWSERTRNLSIKCFPTLKNKIKVSGGCGFDIYKIKPSIKKEFFLKKYNKEKYTKLIGVGCWVFSPFYPNNQTTNNYVSKEIRDRFQRDHDLFNRVLVNIIQSNPTILFILKEHPGNLYGHEMSGIEGTENFENVLILKKTPIIDVIAVSDIWLTYESTTVVEAWMLGKPTCLLNPTGLDFPRANTYMGSPNYLDENMLQNAIDVFYNTGKLPHFDDEKYIKERQKVIKDTIQWDDGLNHVRAGNEIIRVLESKKPKVVKPIPSDIRNHKIKQGLINMFRIKKSSVYQRSSSFSTDEVERFSSSLYQDQIKFYQSLGHTKEKLRQILPL